MTEEISYDSWDIIAILSHRFDHIEDFQLEISAKNTKLEKIQKAIKFLKAIEKAKKEELKQPIEEN